MIKTYEFNGGWTIEIVNGEETLRLECTQYAYKDEHGITWFDFDRAMCDARKLDISQIAGGLMNATEDGWTLPQNWESMSDDDKTAWSLTRNLEDAFPGYTFLVTMDPFLVRCNEDGLNPTDVQREAQDWFYHADGTVIVWGEPQHVSA